MVTTQDKQKMEIILCEIVKVEDCVCVNECMF